VRDVAITTIVLALAILAGYAIGELAPEGIVAGLGFLLLAGLLVGFSVTLIGGMLEDE